jgi:DNA-binding MarR family transcriptional regulator
MRETDPVEQISEALARLRWQGRPMPPRDRLHARGRRHPLHEGRPDRRGAGGPALVRLLAMLAAEQDPLGVSEIAERVGVDQPRASRLVAQGVELGLLRREADAEDARKIRTLLTDEGRALVRRAREDRSAAVGEALAGFSDAERRQFAALLERFAAAWPGAGRGDAER